MDLLVFHSTSTHPRKGDALVYKNYAQIHPVTLQDLQVPALGQIILTNNQLFEGGSLHVRCIPTEDVPENSIVLPAWIQRYASGIETVSIQTVNTESTLAFVKKVVVTPYLNLEHIKDLAGWHAPVQSPVNGEQHQEGKRDSHRIERVVRHKLNEQLVTVGSILQFRVKAREVLYRVQQLQLEQDEKSPQFVTPPLGILCDRTSVDLALEPLSNTLEADTTSGLVKEITRFVADSFSRGEAYRRLNIPNKKAAIVTGVAGSGKKTLVRSSCKVLGLRTFSLSLARTLSEKEIMESDQAGMLSHIHTVFEMALQCAPSAIIMHDLDVIAKDRQIDSQMRSATIAILIKEMERARNAKDVFVFGISRNRAQLPEVFTRPDLFQHEFPIAVPDRVQRQQILEVFTGSDYTGKSLASETAQVSSGYVAKDLRNVYRSALLRGLRTRPGSHGNAQAPPVTEDIAQLIDALSKTTLDNERGISASTVTHPVAKDTLARSVVTSDDLSYAIENSKPSQQTDFESLVHRRKWNEFGGYKTIKKRVHQAVHWPLSNPETFKRMGVKPPMGLLLYGPSGCGKTMLVQALASESNMNFIPIKGPEIFSKYLGETEAKLRRVFAMARQIAPCVIFFDEMDSIGSKRGWGGDGDGAGGSNGVNERVLSTLLNEMDGVEERTDVFVIGCTNRPSAMDDALLRPGRLDQLIYLGYPGLEDRREIIETIARRIPLAFDGDEERLMTVARATVGFSPADLEALFRESAVLSLRRDISSTRVPLEDIQQIIQKMSLSVKDRINKDIRLSSPGEAVQDVVVPELYRQFQQDR
ncbi:hypothetical protein BGZ83_006989 [Gryganskiella cystojenkinii]|nr:hypothetical protein BGZ83_006989 [Gryganskiella cystojenkinii]